MSVVGLGLSVSQDKKRLTTLAEARSQPSQRDDSVMTRHDMTLNRAAGTIPFLNSVIGAKNPILPCPITCL